MGANGVVPSRSKAKWENTRVRRGAGKDPRKVSKELQRKGEGKIPMAERVMASTSTPIFLDNWVANTKLEKGVITKVPVWVRFHRLPAVVYSETVIRLIAERVGRLMRMDEGTSAMCINPWGRNSYARCLIELSAVHDLLEFVEVDIPLPNGKGHYTEYIDIEYEWWPPRCSHCKIFSHEVGICQALKRQVVLGSDYEHVSAKEKVHIKKAGKKGTISQQGSSASGSLWEQFNASTSNNKSPLSGPEDSDDEVDEVLVMESGGFLDDMEDYYDGYDDQVVLPDKLQAICDQFDIRLNTRRR
ncbi:ATPase, F1/V1/A1 complex, alpha/beta subunit, Zinc knuckle CX2CX4HX4C [Artemisia annua]|uniref:ATPase, F1/V1/A1 complex, alpha/beta subunit, Zinc knuckle CX2CX4HX4C n=1 Tax=Artemisia annua TaxID=35608 RepID=A0A2U1LTL2_ARTAN|nr:ATPase, F1/V1/A1 complex, alpha/beta subunit, Zinc knuckle CX2CX4HX4C [Artemisia annua]